MKTELPKISSSLRHRLARIAHLILSICEDKIAKIILFGSYAKGNSINKTYVENDITYNYQSNFDILILIKKDCESSQSYIIKIKQEIEEYLKLTQLNGDFSVSGRPPVSLIIEPINQVNKLLEEGRYFFSDIKKEGILLYDSGEYELSEKGDLTHQERKEPFKDDYDHFFKSASSFLVDCKHAYLRKDYNKAAFELHQATERYYNAILLVFSGYKALTHDIEDLEIRAKNYHDDLLTIFPKDTEKRKKCFELLRTAYIKARHNKNYFINREQLDFLMKRVEKLKGIAKEICLAKIAG